jgi:hypothetical protein
MNIVTVLRNNNTLSTPLGDHKWSPIPIVNQGGQLKRPYLSNVSWEPANSVDPEATTAEDVSQLLEVQLVESTYLSMSSW